jgi:hypothetical protein
MQRKSSFTSSIIGAEFAGIRGAVVIQDAWRMTKQNATDALVGVYADLRSTQKEGKRNE